jgi:PUA domain protein
MFKKFSREEVNTLNQVKSSVQRAVRGKISDQFPYLEDNGVLDVLMPKKTPIFLAKCPGHMGLVIVDNEPLFFNDRDGNYYPTLRLLHKYPLMMKRLRVDRGAIKFVLSGANIMCPGLTSPGATMHDEAEEGTPVAIYAEGKEHAVAIGVTTMSTEAIRKENKGIGVELMHSLQDGLWKVKSVE